MTNEFANRDPRREAFQAGLNRHGYAFQYRLLEEIERLAAEPHSKISWEPLAVEVPVSVQGRSTRIDLLLEMADDLRTRNMIVGEVKRVNPAYGFWCFAKVPFAKPLWLRKQLCLEVLRRSDRWASAGVGGLEAMVHGVGFVVKSGGAGDPHPVAQDSDAIEQACSQVLLGMNGLINMLLQDPRMSSYLASTDVLRLLPVVFTTATILTTEADLSNAELTTGDLAREGLEIQEADWVVHQYPQRTGLKHSVECGSLDHDSFETLVARDFVRSVAIVGPSGIADFLRWSSRLGLRA